MGQWGLSAESLGFTVEDFGPALVYYFTFMWGSEEE